MSHSFAILFRHMVKLRNFVLVTLLLLFSVEGYCADPPAPTSAAVPPPPGLPLPIDDYLPLLLLAGMIYGAVKIPRLKKN
ncbi:hypothetical protein SAMN04488034_101523 [Salinimicrobium catena]|uniref:Uncharacterized protein n=2 Tax=Salinimicrobium catena TaxID=390640 RepID=A0A1H5ITB4_9FLAO|nr:hypothetical protein SAMN04488140_101522 [Salinimicrobium catena]SEE43513.1 hypothetical protein SAMN04488034_101523 [Salinimicrobium catena]